MSASPQTSTKPSRQARFNDAGLAFLALACFALIYLASFAPPAEAAPLSPESASVLTERAIGEIQSVTGLALSPGLVLLATGAIENFQAEDKNALPFYAKGGFLIVLALILALFLIKDLIPFEPLQKLLMAGETGFMKFLALLAFFSIIPGFSVALEPLVQAAFDAASPLLFSAPAMAASNSLRETLEPVLTGLLATIASAAIFVAVFLVANAINVLCLLAPGLAAPILKGFRVAVVAGLTGLGIIHPLLGFLASLFVIILCLILAGWSFRLTLWGSFFSFDLIFRRWRRKPGQDRFPTAKGTQAFAGAKAGKFLKIPKRSLGRLYVENGQLCFSYRRWLLFPKIVPVSGKLTIGRTLTAPILAIALPGGGYGELFFFRLKDKGREAHLNWLLANTGVETFGHQKGAAKTMTWLKSLFGRDSDSTLPA